MLQYDDSALYFVALSSITIYLVPSWYSIIKKVNLALFTSEEDIDAISRTSAGKKKSADLKKTSRGLNTLNSPSFIISLCLAVLFSVIFVWLCLSIQSNGEVNSFDPFTILEIDSGAALKEIKKAYKKMNLRYNLDRNPNNPAAEAMLMMVAKAYEALTDPVAKENWEKYGHPDGKQSLAVSFGLLEFLLNIDNRDLALLTYIVVVIVIPLAVWSYYSNSSKYGEKNVMNDSNAWFHHNLNDRTLIKTLPEAVAGNAEIRERNVTKSQADKQEIGNILDKVKSHMQKRMYNHPVMLKRNVFLHAHLTRQTDVLSEASKFILRCSGSLIDAMISVCKNTESANKLARDNLEDDEKASLVPALRFPFPRLEPWWVALGTKEGKIVSPDKIASPNKVVEHKSKSLAQFNLHVLRNAYLGFDYTETVKLTAQDASAPPEYKVHPDSDAESESDDESEEEGIRELSAAKRNKLKL
eukprot:CAMPEP_0201991478 /NCGR_PEP_ID=MMETSP0905-20130828/296_1 /ASSEMBLY_ACC=CAM_ASM_000554 /TAXON_ID=420261 /ORGANISM="Thalassiosira antarctica, Strain CCMP982" /LENGTH=469 /DNA_ID=CAMNT_0048545895 /DNA_START=186 /DNA_END=1595 /DNA_ORIENTATION=-